MIDESVIWSPGMRGGCRTYHNSEDTALTKLEHNCIATEHHFYKQDLFEFIKNGNFIQARTKQWRCDINITFKKWPGIEPDHF